MENNMENIEQFLQWLGAEDLANIANHGEHGEVVEVAQREDILEDNDGDDDEEQEDEHIDEGIEEDRVDIMGECASLIKNIHAGDSIGGIYCTTVSFTRIPTTVKNYSLCQLCYWRYVERCHPLTKHTMASIHRTTDMTCVPRLYCGACGCNLFTITNIATCTKCNNVKKKKKY